MNSLRFLLVDSDPRKSERISSILAAASHTVLSATGLDEASEALFVERFDAVLLATAFSREGLAEFIAKLRRVEELQHGSPRIPVLSLAGNTTLANQEADEPFDGYLSEPIDPVGLTESVAKLAQALAGESQRQSEMRANALPVLEPDKFKEQVADDMELMVEIIDLFLDERRRQVVEMRECLATQNWNLLSRLAHTIKGSLGSLHATRARARAQELELAAREVNASLCRQSFEILEADLGALEPELVNLRESANSH